MKKTCSFDSIGCGGIWFGGSSDWLFCRKTTTDEQVILVGMQNDSPPSAFAHESSELTGSNIKVVEEINKRSDGYSFDYVATPWDSMFLALELNKTQAVMDHVAKTPECEEKYLFS